MNNYIKNKTRNIIIDNTCYICNKKFNTIRGVMTHLGQMDPCKSKNIENILSNLDNNDIVVCKICNHIGNRIDNHIINFHKITIDDYKKNYGDLFSYNLKSINKHKLNKYRTELWNEDWFRQLHTSDVIKQKISMSVLKSYNKNPHLKEELSKRMCDRIERGDAIGSRIFKRGWYLSKKSNKKYYYQSGFELKIMKLLDSYDIVNSWQKNSEVRLNYNDWMGHNRKYIYDFDIKIGNETILLETKQYPDANLLYKLYSLDKYCKDNAIHWILIKKEKDLYELNKYAI